jgi:hypothetical protein
MPRGERRERTRTPEEEQTTRLFKQARTELGENASSDDVMGRVDELKATEAKGLSTDNKDVANTLRETADNLEVAKKDAFLVRAYRNAAQAVEELPRSVSEMAKEPEKLLEVPGIDKGMLHHIQEVLASGKTEGVKAFPEEKAQQLSRVVSELPNQDLQRLGTRFGLDESKYDFTKREALREGGSKHPIEREKFSKDTQEKLPEALKKHVIDAAKAFDEKDHNVFSPQDLSSTGNAARSRAIIAEAMKRYTDTLAAKGQGGGAPETTVEEPKTEAEKPKEEPKSEKHTYEYTETGGIHQVHARDSEGKSVALVSSTAEENDPRLWTVRYSGTAKTGKSIGEKAYTRLAEAAKSEANRSGKPITIQGDEEMSGAAKHTWEKLESDRGYDVRWKDGRPSITFQPEKE